VDKPIMNRGRHNRDKTHCKRGHEFTPENTISRSNGSRACRTCNVLRQRVGHEPYVEPQIAKPSELDLAWAAGFMDGEGALRSRATPTSRTGIVAR
jgi:late competence protein required for DNA uptake (superfamily II DNA/RNA helicase)